MIFIPRIKKDVKHFLLAESGQSDKSKILKLGTFAALISLSSGVVKAGEPFWNDDLDQTDVISSCKFEFTCDPLDGYKVAQQTEGIELTRTGYAVGICDMGLSDACDEKGALSPDGLGRSGIVGQNADICIDEEDPEVHFTVECGGVYISEPGAVEGTIDFSDLVFHKNSLSLQRTGENIKAMHDHVIEDSPAVAERCNVKFFGWSSAGCGGDTDCSGCEDAETACYISSDSGEDVWENKASVVTCLENRGQECSNEYEGLIEGAADKYGCYAEGD